MRVIVEVEPGVEGSSPAVIISEVEGSPPEGEDGGDPMMWTVI